MNAIHYYRPPADEIFDEVKKACIDIWGTYDDTHGYATEKINRIKDIINFGDNFMYMVAMFDPDNQQKLSKLISKEANKAIANRLKSGGTPDVFNIFLEAK